MHTDNGTDAAADDGEHEKRCLRYAPGAFPRLELIYAHNDKAYEIDNG